MWSAVVLSTGLVLLLGCAVAVVFLMRKQCFLGFTSFDLLATSDSLLSAFIGIALIGVALFQEDSLKSKKCSNTHILAETSTFLVSFVHSFISMFLMAMECWFNERAQNYSRGRNQSKPNCKKRLSIELLTQWLLPIVSVVILHQLTPSNMVAKISTQNEFNNTCEMISFIPSGMPSECYNEVNPLGEQQSANNLTISVVERIYELINGSVMELRDGTNALSQPQTKEDWKNMFMHLQMEAGQEYKKEGIESDDSKPCNKDCELYNRLLQTYFSGLITSTFLISMIGTAVLHRSMANRSTHRREKSIEETQDPNIAAIESEEVCHLNEVKMMVVSNFLTWTPSIIEKVLKKWMCNKPPKWLAAIIFIIGQLSTVFRGLINANPGNTIKHKNKNVIIPLNDASIEEISVEPSDKNMEALFQKRN